MGGPDFIPAPVRARLKDLRLAGRRAAGGHGFGLHASRSRGAGLEFAQYRAYEPGDELRQIDWKLYARSDRFFVRESERDSPLTAWVMIDATASMGQGDAARPGWSRLDAARALAACVFELALRQGDRFGLAVIGGDGLRLVPAGSGPRHRDRCLLELQGLQAGGRWPAEDRLRPLWERIGAGHLALLLSDHFDDAAVALALKLSAARREVLSLQILTAEERDFPFRGGHRFRDVEDGQELLTDAASARTDFLAAFAQARAALAAQLAAGGVRHASHVLDEALDAPLRRLFAPAAGERA
ncbi:DUF58 domain-containing protein [Arenimonas sp. MALMAid1274]|uniref:DUF58 domain-containing protein n=1 Tax=Arenimonas sp. MALMAid1274 TaxID=3411630 RepID=UPI003B9F14BA